MSNEQKRKRHEQILKVREEGAGAFINGVSRERNPYTYSDRLQWWQGWDDAKVVWQEAMNRAALRRAERERDEHIRYIVRDELLKIKRAEEHSLDDPDWRPY